MKVLMKYIFKLFFGPFLIGLGGFIVFVSVEILYQLSNVIVRHRVGVSKLFLLIYYYLPYFTAMGIPVGVLLAIFWIITELSQRRELMALQVHGISLKNLILPFLVISAVLSGITFILNDEIAPRYQEKAEEVLVKYVYKRAGIEKFIVENTLAKYENQYLYIRKYDEKRGIIEGVVLFRYDENGEEIITAEKVIREGGNWYLIDGKYYRVDREGFLRFDSSFKRLKLDIGEDLETFLKVKRPRNMTGKELRKKIETLKKLGVNPSSWLVELHTRYSTSLAPLIIVLVGLSLSLTFNLRSKSWGVILTFILVVLYQGSGAWLSAMGRERLIDPVLSAWLPDIFFSIVGMVLFSLIGTPFEYRIREILTKFAVIYLLVLLSTNAFSENYVVVSDESEISTEIATFAGNVRFEYEGTILMGELAVFHFEAGKLEKITAVDATLLREGSVFFAEEVVFYPDSKSLELFVVSGKIELKGRSEISVSARRSFYTENFVSLLDDVKALGGDFEMEAVFSKVILKDGSPVAVLSPIPVVIRGKGEENEYVLAPSEVHVDLEKNMIRGKIFRGYFTYKEGKRAHKLYDFGLDVIGDKNGIVIEGGGITTCPEDPPHYSVVSSRLVYRFGMYVIAENAVVNVLGVPIFYFPYFFMTLTEGVNFDIGFSFSTDGIKSTYSFGQRYGWGDLTLSRSAEKEKESYSFDMNAHTVLGDLKLSHSFTLVNGTLNSPKTSINLSKIPLPTSPTFSILDDANHSKLSYSLSGTQKVGKGKINYSVSRVYSDGRVNYVAPAVKIGKVSLSFLGGKLSVKSFDHKTSLSFSTGTVFDHIGSAVSTGKISASYSRSILEDFGTSFSISLGSNYSFEGSNPRSYTVTPSFSLTPFSKKFKIWNFSVEMKEGFSGSVKLSKDATPIRTISESMALKSSGSVGPIFGSLEYNRSGNFSGADVLEEIKRKHFSKFSLGLNVYFLKTKVSVSGSYDFTKPSSEALANPVLNTDTAFKLGVVSFKFNTSTSYLLGEERFGKTSLKGSASLPIGDWNLSSSFSTSYNHGNGDISPIKISLVQTYKKNRFKNTVSFTYDPNADDPVRSITSTFKTSKLDLFFFRAMKLSGQLRLSKDEKGWRLASINTKGTFNIGRSKNSLSLRLNRFGDSTSFSVSYSISKFDPSFKISLSGTSSPESFRISSLKLDLTKDLHCWIMKLSGSFSYDGSLNLRSLSLSFYLKEFPNKKVSVDPKAGKIDLNFF